MAVREKMENEEMMVLCQDVLGYMHEHGVTLEVAYEAIGVPEEMQVSVEEMEEFLFPNGLPSK